MADLSKLTKRQLDKMLSDTQAELRRREDVTKAENEIRDILTKYPISIRDIDLNALILKPGSARQRDTKTTRKAKSAGKQDNRATVAAKFKSLDGTKKWSGRGRAPKWVMDYCEKENISIDVFKKDEKFLIV